MNIKIRALLCTKCKTEALHRFCTFFYNQDDVAEPKSVTQTETTTPSAAKARKKRSSYTTRSSRYRIQRVSTPPPGKGRLQALVQTDAYLEYLTDDTHVAETDVTVQTDPIRDQLISPSLEPVRLKTGVDASTQVLPGELNNFDDEVQPVVGTLVAKILEQVKAHIFSQSCSPVNSIWNPSQIAVICPFHFLVDQHDSSRNLDKYWFHMTGSSTVGHYAPISTTRTESSWQP